jgi:hypothetical protein
MNSMENKLDLLCMVIYWKNVNEKEGGIHLVTISHSSNIIEYSIVIQSFYSQYKANETYYGGLLCVCVGSGLALGWSPVQGVLPTV